HYSIREYAVALLDQSRISKTVLETETFRFWLMVAIHPLFPSMTSEASVTPFQTASTAIS
ncbi:MAG: hypothetical protein DWH94_11655, partial [Planctomycetota bacterium]